MPGLIVSPHVTSSTTSTVAFSSNILWANWNSGITSTTGSGSSTLITTNIWTNWNSSYTGTIVTGPTPQQVVRAEPAIVDRVTNEAKEKAAKLLNGCLSDTQREQLKANGHFDLEVLSSNGQRRTYRIERRWSGSVHQIDPATGRKLKTLCIHPRINTPVEDSMLAQKLMLESGMEDQLLKIANHWT